MTHILIIHQAFASLDEPGGTRHYEFARLLADRGERVTIIASPVSYITGRSSIPEPSSIKTERISNNLTILRVRVYAAHHRSFFHRVIAFLSFMISAFLLGLRIRNVDVIWGTSPPIFQGVTAWLLARIKHRPLLLEIRDLWPQFAVAVGVLKNPILIRASEWLERTLYQQAQKLIVNSPGFIQHVRQRGGRDVQLVPNGSDPTMFDPLDRGTDFRHKYLLEKKFIVLYAGAHGVSNDLGVVLEAAGLLSDPGIHIVLLGDGKEKQALQVRATEMGIRNVTFVASVPKSVMPTALAAADACLAILKPLEEYKTTYPNKVFDYMAAGRSVILAIDGAIRSVVEDAGCGIFSKPGDPVALAEAIQMLARDPERNRDIGLAGRDYLLKKFNRVEIAERLFRIFEELK